MLGKSSAHSMEQGYKSMAYPPTYMLFLLISDCSLGYVSGGSGKSL